MANKVYEIITQKIIDSLENGFIPWKKPWNGTNDIYSNFDIPCNYKTGNQYNGLNILLLLSQEKKSRYWLTMKQLTSLGGKLKVGAKASIVTYWTMFEVDLEKNGQKVYDKDGNIETKKIPYLRYSNVFNLDDCYGYTPIKTRKETGNYEKAIAIEKGKADSFITVTACETVVNSMPKKPVIKYDENRAFYCVGPDYVNMPKPYNFHTNHGYYATLFHELTHSTMHKSRLDRKEGINSSRNKGYAFEELVAELGSCFLCAETGINKPELLENSESYIKGWLTAFRNDPSMIVKASSKAQKAVKYILDK